MKKKKSKKVSKLIFQNTFVIIFISVFIFLSLIALSILAFEAGLFFPHKHVPFHRPSPFGRYLLLIFILFVLVIIITLRINYTIARSIKRLENATEQVAKGNFDIQLKLTNNESINSYIRNFNKMVRELNNMVILQSDFIANVSHEFKTPLSVIQSYSKALRKNDLDDETKKQYETVLDNNIKKLTNLTTNILNLSKLENQEIVLNKKEFLLDEQIRQCIVGLQPEWESKNIDFKLTIPKTKYYGSEELIAQVWQNIIGNAIKFSNNDSQISITITKNETEIFVTISDKGIGMGKETLSKIFDKFYQGDISHSKDGNGLGLALVYRILKICNVKISVNSQEGKGSTFVVCLHNTSNQE